MVIFMHPDAFWASFVHKTFNMPETDHIVYLFHFHSPWEPSFHWPCQSLIFKTNQPNYAKWKQFSDLAIKFISMSTPPSSSVILILKFPGLDCFSNCQFIHLHSWIFCIYLLHAAIMICLKDSSTTAVGKISRCHEKFSMACSFHPSTTPLPISHPIFYNPYWVRCLICKPVIAISHCI